MPQRSTEKNPETVDFSWLLNTVSGMSKEQMDEAQGVLSDMVSGSSSSSSSSREEQSSKTDQKTPLDQKMRTRFAPPIDSGRAIKQHIQADMLGASRKIHRPAEPAEHSPFLGTRSRASAPRDPLDPLDLWHLMADSKSFRPTEELLEGRMNNTACKQLSSKFPVLVSEFTCRYKSSRDGPQVIYTINLSKIIKCGSNGLVAFYSREGDSTVFPDTLCVKMFTSKREFLIVQRLAANKSSHCGQASTVPIGSKPFHMGHRNGPDFYAVMMPEYHGSLYDFVLGNKERKNQIQLSKATVSNIIEQLLDQLECLNDVPEYSYQDIKPENILYYKENDDTIRVALADFEPNMFTKHCPKTRRSSMANAEWCQRFSLVVLIAELTDTYADLQYSPGKRNQEHSGYPFWTYANNNNSKEPLLEQYVDQLITDAGQYLKERGYKELLELLEYDEEEEDEEDEDEEQE